MARGGMDVRSSISYVNTISTRFLAGATIQVLLFAMVDRFLRVLTLGTDPTFLARR